MGAGKEVGLIRSEAAEVRHGGGRLFLTVEHASRRVPAPLRTSAADRRWLDTHWGWDIGARDLALSLANAEDAGAVLARFSRLVCDANRAPDDATFIRREIEGVALSFNEGLDEAEQQRRIARYHAAFHDTVDANVAAHRARQPDTLLLSLHSFTPIWGDRLRPMDVGVLYDAHDGLAGALCRALSAQGLSTAHNAPYSGKDGLIYSVQRHARAHGLVYLELELNQSFICTPRKAARAAQALHLALRGLWRRRGSWAAWSEG